MAGWTHAELVACRGCQASISTAYRYCPHCGLFLLRRGQRVYHESRFDARPAWRLVRFMLSGLLFLAWTLLMLWVGISYGRVQPPLPPLGGT